MKIHSTFVAAALLACSVASHAQDSSNCEAIRAQVDAKVRASGVNDFTLSVVESDAQAGGRVVGSCDLGTKKIMYERTGTSTSAAASAAASTGAQPRPPTGKTRNERVITECKDGTVSASGDCKP